MRVDQPFRRLAEFVLGEQGYTEERMRALIGKGERTIRLKTPLPVHLAYFTLTVDETGQLRRIDDLYGHDGASRPPSGSARTAGASPGWSGRARSESPAYPPGQPAEFRHHFRPNRCSRGDGYKTLCSLFAFVPTPALWRRAGGLKVPLTELGKGLFSILANLPRHMPCSPAAVSWSIVG